MSDPAVSERLSVRGLRYAYGERVAVDGVSFAVRRGEIFGLLGPNGAGKTTTVSCLCGLFGRFDGELFWESERFAPSERDEDRARLGVVPQEIALYPRLTGRENLRHFGRLWRLQGADLERGVGRALALSALAERADDLVATYSGGMKRRLNLAAGLLNDPPLLLLDEPTVGVDPQSRAHIYETLLELRAEGRSLLLTTHQMHEAERLCDRIAVLDEGRLVACGTKEELGRAVGRPGADLEEIFLALTGKRLRDDG